MLEAAFWLCHRICVKFGHRHLSEALSSSLGLSGPLWASLGFSVSLGLSGPLWASLGLSFLLFGHRQWRPFSVHFPGHRLWRLSFLWFGHRQWRSLSFHFSSSHHFSGVATQFSVLSECTNTFVKVWVPPVATLLVA